MPVYNAGKYLRAAVLSIVKQTVTDWELLIIDDGSTDNALQNIKDIDDPRVKILRDGENKGLAARLNEAIDMARGLYFARMDQDDVSHPERFSRQLAILKDDTELDLVVVQAVTIDDEGQLIGLLPYEPAGKLTLKPWRGFYMPHPTWMGKLSWFKKFHYSIPAPYFCEDQELLLRSYEQSKFGAIAEPLFAYRLRKEINWSKLLKTRFTLFKFQQLYFLQKRQFFFWGLALLALVGRLTLDAIRSLFGSARLNREISNPELINRWAEILGKNYD